MSGNGEDKRPEPVRPPSITLTFAGPGQSDCAISASPDVKVSQLRVGAFLLDCLARESRAGQVAQEAMRQVTIDPSTLPPELRKLLGGLHG